MLKLKKTRLFTIYLTVYTLNFSDLDLVVIVDCRRRRGFVQWWNNDVITSFGPVGVISVSLITWYRYHASKPKSYIPRYAPSFAITG